jgi:uncharacterized repeat protein (TIGR01451 family)
VARLRPVKEVFAVKFSVVRLLLSVSGSLLLSLGLFWLVSKEPVATAYAPSNSGEARPDALQHLWVINEIFSCADGSVQFVEFFTTFDSQDQLATHFLLAINSGGSITNTFQFLTNLPSTSTGGRTFLVATPGFSILSGGVTPDYTIPTSFVFTSSGRLNFGPNFDIFTYNAGQLPLDGINSLNRNFTTGVNSPKNFAGQTGSVSCPLAVSKIALAAVEPGGLITYTLSVTSSGAISNTNTVLTDTLPASTTFVSASGGISPVNDVLTWTLGTMATSGPTSVASRTFVVSPTASAGTPIINNNYGVRSDQTRAKGSPVQVLLTGADSFIYLPVIIKEFTFVSDHAADLP